jgi:hypothetical protein
MTKLNNSIHQSITGSGNLTIGVNSGGIAISKVDQLIQNFHVSPQNVRTLESFWKNWSQDTTPPFSPKLVIGGREAERERVKDWLRGMPDTLSLQGDSPIEVCAFLAAVIQQLEEEERTNILSRVVVIDCVTSWQYLITSTDPLILVPVMEELEGIGQASQNGHHVFIPSGRISSTYQNVLPQIVRGAAGQALKDMGFSEEEASRLAAIARRSLSALRRKLAVAQNIQQPAWAKPEEAWMLLAPLLASSWDDNCDGDRKALENLSGIPYGDLQTRLTGWVNKSDAPIRRTGDIWMIANQEDAWRLIARYLTSDNLERFKKVALEVLGEINPKFELLPEERLRAAIYGKVLSHSEYLRNGISEMLGLMASLSSEILFRVNQSGEDVVNQIVWELMETVQNNSLLWASIADKLPILAEAAPEILLKAIDQDLAGNQNQPLLANLFQDKIADGISYSPHTDILWTLEILSHHLDYLSQSAKSLAKLTRLDPGGYMANRPEHSLKDIFIWWLYLRPNANNSLDTCLKISNTLYKYEPEVTWGLMIKFITTRNITWNQRKTRWRDWVTDPQQSISHQNFIDVTDAFLPQLLLVAGKDITKWCELITSIQHLNSDQKDIVINYLEKLDLQNVSPEESIVVSNCLRNEIINNQDYSDAYWVMSSQQLQRLEAIRVKIEPDDPVYRHRWLFNSGIKIQGCFWIPYQEAKRIIDALQSKALLDVLFSQGWEGIIQLAQQAENPYDLGIALAKTQLVPISLKRFIDENFLSTEKWRNELAKGYLSFNAYNQGEKWIKDCIGNNACNWSAEKYGEFLLYIPFNNYLIEQLDITPLETQSFFWSSIQKINFLENDYSKHIIEKLIKYGRPRFAIRNIPWVFERHPQLFSPEQIAETLKACNEIEENQSNDDCRAFIHSSVVLMNYLEKTDLSRDRYASLELMYFQAHKHNRYSKTLFENLAKNPEFFVEVIQSIFPRKDKTAVDSASEKQLLDHLLLLIHTGFNSIVKVVNRSVVQNLQASNEDLHKINDHRRTIAEVSWHILEKWKRLPGVLEDSSIDNEALTSWVSKVRELAAERELNDIVDVYIGYSFAFSPPDPDGAWPHTVVRDLIESLSSVPIERGWQTKIYNNRGVTSRSPVEGGVKERKLLEQYKKYSEQLNYQWPRTASVLRDIANSYGEEAKREDTRAELIEDYYE